MGVLSGSLSEDGKSLVLNERHSPTESNGYHPLSVETRIEGVFLNFHWIEGIQPAWIPKVDHGLFRMGSLHFGQFDMDLRVAEKFNVLAVRKSEDGKEIEYAARKKPQDGVVLSTWTIEDSKAGAIISPRKRSILLYTWNEKEKLSFWEILIYKENHDFFLSIDQVADKANYKKNGGTLVTDIDGKWSKAFKFFEETQENNLR